MKQEVDITPACTDAHARLLWPLLSIVATFVETAQRTQTGRSWTIRVGIEPIDDAWKRTSGPQTKKRPRKCTRPGPEMRSCAPAPSKMGDKADSARGQGSRAIQVQDCRIAGHKRRIARSVGPNDATSTALSVHIALRTKSDSEPAMFSGRQCVASP